MSKESQLAVPAQSAITVAKGEGVQLNTLDEMREFALVICQSGLAPQGFKTPEAVIIALQTGRELGLKPMQALQGICVINGRPSLWGDAALAVVMSHPAFLDVKEWFDIDKNSEEPEGKIAYCEIFRHDRTSVKRMFSRKMAQRAGLWEKAIWKQYPDRMLQMRARSWAMRDAFPDALKGIGVSEEVRDYGPPRTANAREVTPAAGLVLPGDPSPEKVTLFTAETMTEEDRRADASLAQTEHTGEFLKNWREGEGAVHYGKDPVTGEYKF